MRDFQDLLPMLASFSMMKNSDSYSTLALITTGLIIKWLLEHGHAIKKTLALLWFSRKCYTVSARMSYVEGTLMNYNVPKTFSALQHVLFNTITKDKNTKTSYSVDNIYTTYTKTMQLVTFNNKHAVYNITPTLCISQEITDTQCEKEGSIFVKYTLHLWSTKNNFKEVVDFIKECEITYHAFMQTTHPSVFVLQSINPSPMFECIPFKSTKTFDNMFFQQKEDLKQRLDYFKNNKAHYDRLGIPYTLGMMFHGQPGTGKTSVIKAIANYTERHLIIIPMDKVTTVDQLKQLFIMEEINQHNIPIDKRLYCFEEIDCGKWKDIVRSRKLLSKPEDSQPVPQKDDIAQQLIETLRDEKEKKKHNKLSPLPSSPITLGDLLEILDGIIETPGRMIIMTSNHPEEIDEALLRPGRIDINIEFKRMTRQDIKHMYELWFQEPMPQHVFAHVKDHVFTQADVGNIFSLTQKRVIFAKLTSV